VPPERVPRPGNERGRATRVRILEAGDRCFETHGLDMTLEQVAEVAGVTRMTVHRHTGGREQMVTQVVLRASARLAAQIDATLSRPGDPVQRLGEGLIDTVEIIRATPSLARLFTGGDVAGPWADLDPDQRVVGAVHDFFRPHVTALAEDGRLRADLTTDEAVAWLLAQALLVLVVPSLAATHSDLTRFFHTLAVPAVTSPLREGGPREPNRVERS